MREARTRCFDLSTGSDYPTGWRISPAPITDGERVNDFTTP